MTWTAPYARCATSPAATTAPASRPSTAGWWRPPLDRLPQRTTGMIPAPSATSPALPVLPQTSGAPRFPASPAATLVLRRVRAWRGPNLAAPFPVLHLTLALEGPSGHLGVRDAALAL